MHFFFFRIRSQNRLKLKSNFRKSMLKSCLKTGRHVDEAIQVGERMKEPLTWPLTSYLRANELFGNVMTHDRCKLSGQFCILERWKYQCHSCQIFKLKFMPFFKLCVFPIGKHEHTHTWWLFNNLSKGTPMPLVLVLNVLSYICYLQV